jgi:hypothetical protein
MKSTELKKMIKEVVKEAIQEELKDILLEAVRSPKTVVSENVSIPTPQLSSQPTTNAKEEYKNIMAEMMGGGQTHTTNFTRKIYSQGPVDPANGTLPEGELGMDQIMGLLNNK